MVYDSSNEAQELQKEYDKFSSLYHFSTPNVKLYYPEPFVASGTFIHYDLWFLHIAIYQYWLWFFFVSIIIFFFISYLVACRWCQIRNKPQRETRGVSRSKCGDLITAFVPVNWASSIIIHESTDALEYYEGFGSTEMAVGIRAYQWGWEYYYPKNIDLTYNFQSNRSIYSGKSLNNLSTISDIEDEVAYYNHSIKRNNESQSIIGDWNILLRTMNICDKSDQLTIWDFKNFGFSRKAIQWAYKSISDKFTVDSGEIQNNFFSYSMDNREKDYYKSPLYLGNKSRKYNGEWANFSSAGLINASKAYDNLNALEEVMNMELESKLKTNKKVFENKLHLISEMFEFEKLNYKKWLKLEKNFYNLTLFNSWLENIKFFVEVENQKTYLN